MNLRLSRLYFAFVCGPLVCCALLLSGCEAPKTEEKPKQESIIGKTTQDIGEYDPDGDAEIADLQVASDASPLGAAAGAYKFAAGRTSELKIQQALELFRAEHGNYPKDYAEFVDRIVKPNNIQLPVLPGKRRYQYDVKNHKLVVVEAEAVGTEANEAEASPE